MNHVRFGHNLNMTDLEKLGEVTPFERLDFRAGKLGKGDALVGREGLDFVQEAFFTAGMVAVLSSGIEALETVEGDALTT